MKHPNAPGDWYFSARVNRWVDRSSGDVRQALPDGTVVNTKTGQVEPATGSKGTVASRNFSAAVPTYATDFAGNAGKATKAPPARGDVGPATSRPSQPSMADIINALLGSTGKGGPTPGTLPLTLAAQGLTPATADMFNSAGEFAGQVEALRRQLGISKGSMQAALKNLNDWYGQVSAAQQTAGARDAAIGKAGVDSLNQAAQAIVSSLGGSANPAAAVVGEGGAQNVGTLQALSSAQDQYNSDIGPILQLAKAGALSDRQAQGQQEQAQLMAQIAAAQGQQAAAAAADRLGLLQYNNQLAGQRFSNQMALRQYNAGVQQQADQAAQSAQVIKLAMALYGGGANVNLKGFGLTHPKPSAAAKPPATAAVDPSKLVGSVITTLGGDPTTRRLPKGLTQQQIVTSIGSTMQAAKIPKTDPRYSRLGYLVLSGLRDYNGNPIPAAKGWFS